MARNQQVQPKGPQAGPGRPQLTNIKSAVKPAPLGDKLMTKVGKKPKVGKKLLIMILVVLVVAGGGFFGYRHWRHPARAYAKGAAPAATSGPQADYSLTAITVNLADVNTSHFLRIQVVLQYPQSNAALGLELKNQEYIVDDKIISDLRTKTFGELATDQGEQALKQELLHAVNGVLTKGQISGVYFDQFLIQ